MREKNEKAFVGGVSIQRLRKLSSALRHVVSGSGPTYPDAYIERWGDVYAQHAWLRDIGVTFEMFLQQPERVMASPTYLALVPASDHFRPLLPAQRAVQARLDAEAFLCGLRDDPKEVA